MEEALVSSITVKIKLEKFDGDMKLGDEPVEIIEREETITNPQQIQQLMKDIQNAND